jgi:hypothetical protein
VPGTCDLESCIGQRNPHEKAGAHTPAADCFFHTSHTRAAPRNVG